MSPQGGEVLHRTYHAVVGRHPEPGMEEWEIIRAVTNHMYRRGPAGALEPGLWKLFIRTAFEEVDGLDPRTAELVEEELITQNESSGGSFRSAEVAEVM